MNDPNIGIERQKNQLINSKPFKAPEEVLKWMGAMQAQDYLGALWMIGLRMPSCTEKDVETALTERKIVRTWPMRGTLHFVAAENVRWMLNLLTPRVMARSAGYNKKLELTELVISRSRDVLSKQLEGGKQFDRQEIYRVLEDAGIRTNNLRGNHIIGQLAMEGLICFGPRRDKQQTFVLLDEWIPAAAFLHREEALAKLARMYFTSRGPAQVKDLAWWAGLTMKDANEALELVKDSLEQEVVNDRTFWYTRNNDEKPIANRVQLLPGFDEYILGYSDRSDVLKPDHESLVNATRNGIFSATILKKGKIIGMWKRTLRNNKVEIQAKLFSKFGSGVQKEIESASKRYGKFLGCEVHMNIMK